MIGVVFFRDWNHCGFTDGTWLIDSRPRFGVTKRHLPEGYAEIFWLDDGDDAWLRAEARIGEPYSICSEFICQCMGAACILPWTLQRMLRR